MWLRRALPYDLGMPHEETFARAAALAADLLGVELTGESVVFDLATEVLGPERAACSIELAGRARLTRRHSVVANIAALVVATRRLGENWWYEPHVVGYGDEDPEEHGVPERLLQADTAASEWERYDRSSLPTLAHWAADAVADDTWGTAVDYVDLNFPALIDRVWIPPGARPGDRLVVAYDAGSRIWATVEGRDDDPSENDARWGWRRGRLGTRLDLDSCRHSDPGSADWAVSVALTHRTIRLPGEIPETVSDPWARPLDADATAQVRAFGTDHGVEPEVLGEAWLAARDAFGCLVRYGWPWSGAGGPLWRWAHAVENLIDGEATESPPSQITA